MTKNILITAAAFAALLPAQNNFQSSAWMSSIPNDAQHALRPDGQTGPVMGKPFSAVETRQTKSVLSDGTPVNKSSVSKIYRDAEGRMRAESGSTAVLFDAPNLMNYTINAKSCSQRPVRTVDSIVIAATDNGTWVSTQSHTGNTNAKPNPHITTQDLGFQLVNGISAQGTRQTLTIPGQSLGADHDIQVVNERWYSEALGVLVKSSNVDPRFGTTTYELSNINQSTPDASLFTPPTGCN